ncbi:unnamed protein product [Didymodactylos carnosus]|uniref:Uncharacterized protein n=1 Tax=Didymodactylos carnosus TaxID=1234261 RepID=A0A814U0B8_9BILA|nr:unnamed protein product [Didymodactylos carnosus]CAF1169205.1 unnamed protein product [Didymodactylos carnosus]CAF3735164.1 unnamed protein product [Didymodactylos carnosus]CAF3932925.1 unnamed protein product [Didymodactylos carnosus]
MKCILRLLHGSFSFRVNNHIQASLSVINVKKLTKKPNFSCAVKQNFVENQITYKLIITTGSKTAPPQLIGRVHIMLIGGNGQLGPFELTRAKIWNIQPGTTDVDYNHIRGEWILNGDSKHLNDAKKQIQEFYKDLVINIEKVSL